MKKRKWHKITAALATVAVILSSPGITDLVKGSSTEFVDMVPISEETIPASENEENISRAAEDFSDTTEDFFETTEEPEENFGSETAAEEGSEKEAVGIVSAIAYLGLQIYYGIAFHVNPVNLMMNLVFMILVYVGLTLLAVYPERVNGLTREVCSGKIRQYTLRMVRMVKLVFVEGLLFTSVCDALGKELKQGYSLIIVVLIAAIAVYYEGRIIHILKQNNKR